MPSAGKRRHRRRKRTETAATGGSRVLLAARLATGGTHGRRRAVRRVERERAIREDAA